MHEASLKIMKHLLDEYEPNVSKEERFLYDVGSADVNGSYRKLLEARGWRYAGIDIASGKNVDIVVPADDPDPRKIQNWRWHSEKPITPAPLVVSGQCMEHTRYPWQWLVQVSELLQPGGTLLLIAPAAWPQHRFPIDCFRFLPDGMASLATWAGLELIHADLAYAQRVPSENKFPGFGQRPLQDGVDCFAVMKKPA